MPDSTTNVLAGSELQNTTPSRILDGAMQTHTHTHIYIYIYTHTHTHTYTPKQQKNAANISHRFSNRLTGLRLCVKQGPREPPPLQLAIHKDRREQVWKDHDNQGDYLQKGLSTSTSKVSPGTFAKDMTDACPMACKSK